MQAVEEANRLTEENDELKKEIEQLQTDRCADVEELVYLRWVNACLRYELRNYQPASGKTVARDLSKCLSPESEKKAKQLILDYANSGSSDQNINLFDFNTESCSSSHTSSEDYSDASIAVSSLTKNSDSRKSKLISKLKKLVLGKNDSKRSQLESLDGRRISFDSGSSCISTENASPHYSAQSQRYPGGKQLGAKESAVERSRSDLGTSRRHMRMISESHSSDLSRNLDHCEDEADVTEKAKLRKFADVLKGSSSGHLKSKRRMSRWDERCVDKCT